MKTAADIMETEVVSVSPDALLMNVHRTLVEAEIHGAPVVDDAGTVLGVISMADLVRAVADEQIRDEGGSRYLEDMLDVSQLDWEKLQPDFRKRLGQLRVSDAMTPSMSAVKPGDPISSVARQMRRDRVHRVLVIADDALVGIISSFDLVALLEEPT